MINYLCALYGRTSYKARKHNEIIENKYVVYAGMVYSPDQKVNQQVNHHAVRTDNVTRTKKANVVPFSDSSSYNISILHYIASAITAAVYIFVQTQLC